MINPQTKRLTLNPRLSLCQSFVTKGGVACDVGTDHGYLASSLAVNDISKKVYACDIAEGPLSSAKATVEAMGLKDKVTLVLSDGLKNVFDEEITDVIVAGMGGELISAIVLREDWLKRGVNLVLQPQTKAEDLRRDLYLNGYEILSEKACKDGRFIYTVINARYSGEKRELSKLEALVGKLDVKDDISKEYIKTIAVRLETASKGILNSASAEKISEGEKMFALSKSLLEYIGE